MKLDFHHVWSAVQHPSGDAVKDYSLAGALITSPGWAPYLTDINGWLTTIGLVLGVILAARRLWRDIKENGKG